MKIRINVTKEVLEKSKKCNLNYHQNCAIACAVKDLFPMAEVHYAWITFNEDTDVMLPDHAKDFIRKFDSLKAEPQARAELHPISFDIDVPSSVIDEIGIQEVERILSKSETLEKV